MKIDWTKGYRNHVLLAPDDPAGDPPKDPPAKVDPPADPPVDPRTAKTGEEPPVDPPAPPAKPTKDWRDDRIDAITAKRREAENALRDAQAELAALKAGKQGDPTKSPEFNAEVARRAEAIAQQKSFDAACEAVTAEGRDSHPDFDAKAVELLKVGGDVAGDPQALRAYTSFINSMIETGKAAELIYELGSNLNEANRIFKLSPTKQAVELTKLALTKVEPVSQAKKPITPLGRQNANTQGDIDPGDVSKADTLTTAEWMRRREAQVKSQNGAARRG
jgi:hypothetical protein